MQKIIPGAFHALTPSAHQTAVLIGGSVASSPVFAYYFDMPSELWGLAAILALAACVLLLLDGMKQQYEARAFFGTFAGVAAGLIVSGALQGDNYSSTEHSTDAAASAATAAVEAATAVEAAADTLAHAMHLQVGDQRARGDEGLELTSTTARLKVSCQDDISVHIYASQLLPKALKVSIVATDLEPSTRLALDAIDTSDTDGFERIFKMDTRCDLLNYAAIEVVGLKAVDDPTLKPKVDKITVQIRRF